MRAVEPDGWIALLTELHGRGLVSLDLLTAVDRGELLEVVARLVDPVTGAAELVSTRLPAAAPTVPTATTVHPGAAWHERETSEMFGIVFAGHPDPRPLLLRSAAARPPLRKDASLPERVTTPWPGVSDGGRARRPQLPPGVRESWTAVADD